MVKLYAKIVDEKQKLCDVGVGTNVSFYQSIGMREMDVEEGYDGKWYLEGYAPVEPVEHKNEIIRQERQVRFAQEADPLRFDYDEALARGEEQAEEKKQAWLEKKDEIRTALPYLVE